MTDKKFTDDNEIIENLTEFLLVAKDGYSSSLENGGMRNRYQEHYIETLTDSINLIKRQKLEIERLKGSTIVNNIMEGQRIKREAKVEAYKEFAERLRSHSYIMSNESQTGIINKYSVVTVNQIDNLLKEIVDV